jgi:hypothetical protein
MAATLYSELIDRAKGAADMHDSFPDGPNWMYFLNAEYRKLWVKIVRAGFPITVNRVIVTSTGATSYTIPEPSAVLGIFELYNSNSYYKIPIRPMWSQYAISTGTHPKAVYVSPNVAAGTLTLNFYPTPASGAIFHVIVIDKPKKIVSGTPAAGESNSVDLPFGWEERVSLGMAKRALTAEETVNGALLQEIAETDEQIDFHIHDYILRQANTVENMRDLPSQYSDYREWYYV